MNISRCIYVCMPFYTLIISIWICSYDMEPYWIRYIFVSSHLNMSLSLPCVLPRTWKKKYYILHIPPLWAKVDKQDKMIRILLAFLLQLSFVCFSLALILKSVFSSLRQEGDKNLVSPIKKEFNHIPDLEQILRQKISGRERNIIF